MQTTIDIDEKILREAEQHAREQGKSLARLMEEALRQLMHPAVGNVSVPPDFQLDDRLGDEDPFFAALEEVRAAGRTTLRKQDERFD